MRLSLYGIESLRGGQHAGIQRPLPARPRLRACILLPLLLAMTACANKGEEAAGQPAAPGIEDRPGAASLNASPAESSVAPAARQADAPQPQPEGVAALLEQARWALDAGRLTHPPRYNAREYYQQVLQLHPTSREAREGLQIVLDRSIELSLEAAHQGNFKRAELLLTRAGRFALNDPGIRGAREYVHRMSRQGRRTFPLPAEAVRARDADALAPQLKQIVRHAVEDGATIEILTADDLQALWLFDQLRQHAGKEALHATIHDAQEPEVRLTWRR